MVYSLLDLEKSETTRDLGQKYKKYQSLPPGVIEVHSYQYWTTFKLLKIWHITFKGALDLNKLKEICKQNNYFLIEAKKTKKKKKVPEWEGIRMYELFRTSGIEELLSLSINFPKPDIIAYHIYRKKKEIAYICNICDNTFDFNTLQKGGLELAEDYRKSFY